MQDVAVEVCQAVSRLPTWMGYTTKWKVRCVSLAEANDILVGCKRLEKENRRQECLHFQEQLASMHQFSNLSAMAVPFQPQATLPTPRLADAARGHQEPERDRSAADLSPLPRTVGSFRDRSPSPAYHPHSQASDDGDLTTDGNSTDYTSHRKKRRSRGSRSSQAGRSDKSTSNSNKSTSSNGGKKKKDGFSSKIQIPAFGGKKGHSDDVTGAFRQWARCITYYRDYYEDSYLVPLVVSSLTGDASDVFDWIRSLNPGNAEDLTALLQMLREHYCGSLTLREQRNTIENLHQKPQEAAIDFLIRVSTSVSNLGKDWKDELTEDELRSLQYEVSLNGVKEEIRHVLNSEIARRGQLTLNRCTRRSRSMKLMWPITKGLVVRALALLPVSRRLLVIPLVTSLGFIKLQLLLQPLRRQRMMSIILKNLLLWKKSTPKELSHLKRMMRDCTFLVTWRRLYQTIQSYR